MHRHHQARRGINPFKNLAIDNNALCPELLVYKNDAIMSQHAQDLLKSLAKKYIWWKTPEEAVSMPGRVIAQVMNIGDYADVQMLVSTVGNEVLREVIRDAEPGQFNERSWTYWHYRLGLSDIDQVPALPTRRVA